MLRLRELGVERGHQRLGAWVPIRGNLGEEPLQHLIQAGWNRVSKTAHGGHRIRQAFGDDRLRSGTRVWRLTRQQLEAQAAEAVEIASTVQRGVGGGLGAEGGADAGVETVGKRFETAFVGVRGGEPAAAAAEADGGIDVDDEGEIGADIVEEAAVEGEDIGCGFELGDGYEADLCCY